MNTVNVNFKAMGGPAQIHLLSDMNESQLNSLIQEVKHEIHRIEKKYSRYDPQSVISKINRNAGIAEIEIDQETQQLLDYANALYEQSQTLFDPTCGVLRRIWSFTNPRIPNELEREQMRKLIGWDKVVRNGTRVFLKIKGMELDFGGFGKEYAVDRAASLLKSHGVKNGFVNLSGDIFVLGPKADAQPWSMGIQHPRQKDQLLASIPVRQGALATSGDYERYFELNGARYCHVLHPQTTSPVQFWQSISVVAPLTSVAGACTSIAMLKEVHGLEYLQKSGFAFLAVSFDGKVHSSNAQTNQS